HHVGADALQKASSEQHNYLKDGFYAKSNAEEIKCADLELNVLVSTEDVTARVNVAVKDGMSPDEATKARGKAIAAIDNVSKEYKLHHIVVEINDTSDRDVPKLLRMFNIR